MVDQADDPISSFPGGVVAFLFTDIEGSSRLEQRIGTAAYAEVRERHRTLLRAVFAAHRGSEQGTSGDSFFVVFPTAREAVEAAVDAQRGLAAEPWPEAADVRVRIGIHAGEAIRAGRDYVGIDINRAARIEAAAHGGQIVVSDSVRALAGGPADAGISFVDLGLNRLKDFEPLRLHQVVADGLAREFPPLRSLDIRFVNVQPPVTSFVGRKDAVEEVRGLLESARLVTLSGPGGTGKTRLAIAASQAALAAFAGGAVWVSLSPIADPALVPSAVSSVLGVVDDGTRDLVDAIADKIGPTHLLLVLDNFEQVTPAAPVVSRLIARCAELTILVTSRVVLRLAGEREYPVPPLEIPDPSGWVDVEAAMANEAIALFVDRARAIRPDFSMTAAEAATIAAIVARLDGLPLAIELAAARIRILPPAALLGRLEHSLGVLAGGPRDLPERQQTLRGAIAWSYDLLDADERALFRRLAVFAGGWDIESVGPVCDPQGSLGIDPLDGLGALVEKSLVRQMDDASGQPRFRMLQTIREFGLERLAEADEIDATRDRHLDLVAALAREAEHELIGVDARHWLDRLELEHDNIRTALRWALDAGHVEVGLLTAGRLWRFWHQHGHLGEGLAMTRLLLSCPGGETMTAGRATALNGAGGLAYWQNDFPAARGFYEEHLAVVSILGDRAGVAEAHYNLAFLAAIPGDHARATAEYEEALAIWRELDNAVGIDSALLGLALAAFLRNDLQRAATLADETIAHAERIGDRYRLASGVGLRGRIDLRQGRFEGAKVAAVRSLTLFAEVSDPTGISMQLDDLGEIALRTGDPLRALLLASSAATVRERIAGGAPPTLVQHGDYAAEARAAAGAEADAAWASGRSLALDEAIAYALEVAGPEPSAGTTA